jgi:omega-amidase
MIMRRAGASILVFPGAFNMTTGPAHWELLARARAVDSQCFVAAVSPARNPESTYQAWGHSTVVNPWGEVVATTGHNASIIYADIDPTEVKTMRESIPVYKQKREDLYTLKSAL